jgi:myosin-5
METTIQMESSVPPPAAPAAINASTTSGDAVFVQKVTDTRASINIKDTKRSISSNARGSITIKGGRESIALKINNVLIATLQKHGYDLDLSNEDGDARSSLSSSSILTLRDKKNNQSAFHIAARKGHLDVIRALAKLPRVEDHINAGDRHANTALHFAASNHKECAAEMCDILINLGAKTTGVNVRGQTPLSIHIMTAKEDNPAIVRALCKKGATPLNDLIGNTTYLHMAVENNLLEIAGALISAGASINIPDYNGIMLSDTIQRKVLVNLTAFMKEGTQVQPVDAVRKTCKLCKSTKGMLDKFKDCNLCGRTVCKTCSKKASEVKHVVGHDNGIRSPTSAKPKAEKAHGRYCTVCTTAIVLRNKHHKEREGFNQKLFGMSLK